MDKLIHQIFKSISLLVIAGALFLLASPVLAASDLYDDTIDKFQNTSSQAGYEQTDPGNAQSLIFVLSGQVVALLVSLAGVVVFIFLVYGGYLWLTAGGNEDQVTKAKEIIKNSIIGLVLLMAAGIITYTIYNLVVSSALGENYFL